MVKPLYPLSDISPDKRKRMKDAEKARKEYILSRWKKSLYNFSGFSLFGSNYSDYYP